MIKEAQYLAESVAADSIIKDIGLAVARIRAHGYAPDTIRMSVPVYRRFRRAMTPHMIGNAHQRRVLKRRAARISRAFA